MVLTGGITRAVVPGQEPRPSGADLVSRRYITPGLLPALGVPLLAGRDFEESDTGDRGKVAVVSQSFTERYWPGEIAIGKSFFALNAERTVIGIVGDVRVRGLERTSEPQMYLPRSEVIVQSLSAYDLKDLVIRTAAAPTAIIPAVREIIRRADPDQPISDVRTLAELLGTQTATRRAQVRILAVLAAVALLLSGIGIHGLLAFTVAQRRREIGVRLALGAEPSGIARRVAWDGVRLVLLGVGPGLVVAYGAARSMSALLFGVPPADVATLATAVGLCLCTGLVGAAGAALRAVRVNPLTVIQAE
jgi:ABC-type antimicrobial peptide transport system permease subunit